MRIWVRLGDGAGYNDFDDVQDVIDFFLENQIVGPLDYFQGRLQTPEYRGNNYISLYWGDEKSNWEKSLSQKEIRELKRRFRRKSK